MKKKIWAFTQTENLSIFSWQGPMNPTVEKRIKIVNNLGQRMKATGEKISFGGRIFIKNHKQRL